VSGRGPGHFAHGRITVAGEVTDHKSLGCRQVCSQLAIMSSGRPSRNIATVLTPIRVARTTGSPGVATFDMKLEVGVIPVSDVDRAKEFYSRLGWRLDADRAGENFRLVQFTPPGSGSSIQFGINLTSAAPGSAQGMLLAVADIEVARQQLLANGVDASDVFHCETGTACRFVGIGVRVSEPHADRLSYYSFVSFSDPDGNGWLLQEVTKRLPGRVAGDTTFASAHDLAQAMRRAATAHGKHEARTGKPIPSDQTGTPSTWCANNPANSRRNERS
jgi:catechol 2,3-dioxygenase-like lactoylglutathione lyase family enzyme